MIQSIADSDIRNSIFKISYTAAGTEAKSGHRELCNHRSKVGSKIL